MKLTDEQIQAIIDGAPEWDGCYNVNTNNYIIYSEHRNIGDLREILELRQEVEQQQQRIAELEATVERLRDALIVCHNAHNDFYIEQRDVAAALKSTPATNLNHVKREALLSLAADLGSTGGIDYNIIECIEVCANTKYPKE